MAISNSAMSAAAGRLGPSTNLPSVLDEVWLSERRSRSSQTKIDRLARSARDYNQIKPGLTPDIV